MPITINVNKIFPKFIFDRIELRQSQFQDWTPPGTVSPGNFIFNPKHHGSNFQTREIMSHPPPITAGNRPPAALSGMARLLATMARLRSPSGCPWDREQTHRSLIPFLVEEVHELIEALETGPESHFREELGDVLLQVVFHAQIAHERGAFHFDALANDLADKLEQRHPHVFSGEHAPDAEAVSQLWHRNKMSERQSALDGIPAAMPALAWAFKVGARAARAGFEWRNSGEILDKISEEIREIQQAAQTLRDSGAGQYSPEHQHLEEEFGDLLFAQVQLARWLKLDPEAALRRGVRKFSARYRWMEQTLQEQGSNPEQLAPGARTPETWWRLWEQAKAAVG